MITIIDYGMGNLRSVQKIFEKMRVPVQITRDPGEIGKAEKLVLPGVGHFQRGMEQLTVTGIADLLKHKVQNEKTPVLGICLGMQLMTTFSEEGNTAGLNWIAARTSKFSKPGMKIPHMGWNNARPHSEHALAKGVDLKDLFYFVHSYYVTCDYDNEIAFETTYDNVSFVSGFQKGHIMGTQFHPEKSYGSGIRILSNFAQF